MINLRNQTISAKWKVSHLLSEATKTLNIANKTIISLNIIVSAVNCKLNASKYIKENKRNFQVIWKTSHKLIPKTVIQDSWWHKEFWLITFGNKYKSCYKNEKKYIKSSYLFWTIKLIFRRATYWTSGSLDNKVTNGGASFFVKVVTNSESGLIISMSFIRTCGQEKYH